MRDEFICHDQEERLEGGNTAGSVVRLGSTVLKPATPSTPAVQSFVTHLRSVGFDAPEPLGIDDRGRQVWEYVPGPLWHGGSAHTLADLRRVGVLIRDLHGAAATFHAPEEAQWDTRYGTSGRGELVCHNDLAPWNLVCGESRWTFIDWDATALSTRLWDLAWSCISFPPFEPGCELVTAATAMRALLSGYDLEPARYGDLIRLMVTRSRAEYDLIVEGAREGRQPWVKLHAEGHQHYWGPVSDYIDRNAQVLEAALVSF